MKYIKMRNVTYNIQQLVIIRFVEINRDLNRANKNCIHVELEALTEKFSLKKLQAPASLKQTILKINSHV